MSITVVVNQDLSLLCLIKIRKETTWIEDGQKDRQVSEEDSQSKALHVA